MVGFLLLGFCAAMSLMLVLEHLAGLSLPGCGAGSPCSRAAGSVWGTVPVLQWPVSFLGLAYFVAVFCAWPAMRGGAPAAARWLIRLGALASVGFVLVMIFGHYLCPYCLATHVSNLAFWLLVERYARHAAAAGRVFVVGLIAFAGTSGILAVLDVQHRHAAQANAERQAEADTRTIIAGSTNRVETAAPASRATVAQPPPAGSSAPVAASTAPARTPPRPPAATRVAASQPAPLGFVGRYRLGPESSPIRIVIFMDYQCKGCHIVEAELRQVMQQHPQVSLSVKQWPAGKDCNLHAKETGHENSCLAARVAEAAGILHGNDGFWQMHFWLFDHSGQFAHDQLRAALVEFGYDPDEFQRVVDSDEVDRRIQADIEEGFNLGLTSTPMVLVNGFDFKGWSAPQAMQKLIEQLETKNLPSKTNQADHPVGAVERIIGDWKGSRARALPEPIHSWPRGPADAKVKVLVWGDYEESYTAIADAVIREFAAQNADTLYTFRMYPLDAACNGSLANKKERSPNACRAAQAAQAAGAIAGADGYWRMHEWLMTHQSGFNDDALRAALPALGFDPTAFFTAMEDPDVAEAIRYDIRAGDAQQFQHVPLIFINNKMVPRWMHDFKPVLGQILEAARDEQAGTSPARGR